MSPDSSSGGINSHNNFFRDQRKSYAALSNSESIPLEEIVDRIDEEQASSMLRELNKTQTGIELT